MGKGAIHSEFSQYIFPVLQMYNDTLHLTREYVVPLICCPFLNEQQINGEVRVASKRKSKNRVLSGIKYLFSFSKNC